LREGKSLCAKDNAKAVGAALRPFRVVVPGDDVPRFVQGVKYLLRFAQFSVRPELGDIAGDDDKGHGVDRIDVVNSANQVLISPFAAYMGVGHKGKTEPAVLAMHLKNEEQYE